MFSKVFSHSDDSGTANPLDDILTISADWRNSRESIIARNQGIKEAKENTLKETNGLLWIGKKLSYAVVFVSAVHIWETLARIAPSYVPPLQLDPFVYHASAFVFTVMIDIIAVFKQKAHGVLSQVKVKTTRSIWYFYAITALLNATSIAANSPNASQWLKNGLVEFFSNLFLFLLPLCIPIAIIGIEESNKQLQALKVLLTVDIATLSGLIDANKTPVVVENKTVVINNTSTPPQLGTVDTLENVVTQNKTVDKVVASKVKTCAKCGALLPSTGNGRKDQGAWLATRHNGCEMCKPKV